MDGPPPMPYIAPPVPNKNEQTMGMLCHLASFSGYVIPCGHIIAPLILWSIKRQEMPFVESEGKESLNFQLSMTIYTLVSLLLCLVFVGIFMLFTVMIANFVFVIIASVKASNGESYRYPLCIRFIK